MDSAAMYFDLFQFFDFFIISNYFAFENIDFRRCNYIDVSI